jgi:transposase
MSSQKQPVFGIDVSKQKLDIASYPDNLHRVVSNDETGITELIQLIEASNGRLVVMESTGGLERQCAERLVESDIDVAVVNPRQARDFAKACGQLEKTDQIDASGLARMGEALDIDKVDEVDSEHQRLKQLVRFRDKLVEQRSELKNRGQRQPFEDLTDMLEEQIDELNQHIDKINDKIDELLSVSDDLKTDIKRLQTVPGVGQKTAQCLIANLPELGQLNRKEVAKLAGVAPLNDDSGKRNGNRTIRGGRPRVRKVLYMAVLSAKRWCEPIENFYNRLRNRGKKKKVAICACMRKLITILNSMMRTQTVFEPQKAMPN